ncbi:hypothetical protein H4R19_003632 [Coemansia spiralis]|nr:hypothetical protein H4R19_003632 [Coemansia spiralis]
MKFAFVAASALAALAAAAPLSAAPSSTGSHAIERAPVGNLIQPFLSLVKSWAAGNENGHGHGHGALPTFLDASEISELEEIEDYLDAELKKHGGQGHSHDGQGHRGGQGVNHDGQGHRSSHGGQHSKSSSERPTHVE